MTLRQLLKRTTDNDLDKAIIFVDTKGGWCNISAKVDNLISCIQLYTDESNCIFRDDMQ